jgi:multidrug efflux system membrane fusion protein
LNTHLDSESHSLFTRRRLWLIGVVLLILVLIGFAWRHHVKAEAAARDHAPKPIQVDIATTKRMDVPVYLQGIGNVQAYNTVTVTARVDGQIQKIGFVEGQQMKKGDLIAQIDPRPFQAALDQAIATKAKDIAQLQSAKQDLKRYEILAPEELASKQQIDTQRATVGGFDAQVKGDEAAIENARTQLAYTTITAPIDGLTGIRRVDVGNIVHASDTGGIVVLTQVQPISVIFTLPDSAVSDLTSALQAGATEVVALSRDGKTDLDHGTLTLIDNQIDQTTGTIRNKATFDNHGNRLWPGEFVNARVLIRTDHGVLTVPSPAVQRGPDGLYVYVVKQDSTVEVRPIKISMDNDTIAVLTDGLQADERVVTSNHYRLQPGVLISDSAAKNPAHQNAAGSTAQKNQ